MNSEDTVTENERKLIVELCEKIKADIPPWFLSQSEDDQAAYLVRWLRAREYNIDNAANMLRNNWQWRRERNADFASGKLLDTFFSENYPYKFPGLDKKGQPIILIPLSSWDFRKLLNNPQRLGEFDDFVMKFFETIMNKLRTENMLRKGTGQRPVTQVTFINDVRDYPYAQLRKFDAVRKIFHIFKCYESHYPEIMYRGIFINCPPYFGIFVNMLKHVVSPRTHCKIRYYSYTQQAKWKTEMAELVDPVVLPEQYGGSRRISGVKSKSIN